MKKSQSYYDFKNSIGSTYEERFLSKICTSQYLWWSTFAGFHISLISLIRKSRGWGLTTISTRVYSLRSDQFSLYHFVFTPFYATILFAVSTPAWDSLRYLSLLLRKVKKISIKSRAIFHHVCCFKIVEIRAKQK